jgi:hypothetical protein
MAWGGFSHGAAAVKALAEVLSVSEVGQLPRTARLPQPVDQLRGWRHFRSRVSMLEPPRGHRCPGPPNKL